MFALRKMENVEISDKIVNPCGEKKLGPNDFDLLKTIGQGGYGKVGDYYYFLLSLIIYCNKVSNY